MCTQIWQRT